MGAVHHHAFLPPRTLAPLSDERTFNSRNHELHVLRVPAAAELASGSAAIGEGISFDAQGGIEISADNGGSGLLQHDEARLQVLRATAAVKATEVEHSEASRKKEHQEGNARGDTTTIKGGQGQDSWSPPTGTPGSQGSVPLRRSSRLHRSSTSAAYVPEPEGHDRDRHESLNVNSYSRLSSSLGSEFSLPASKPWPASGPSASISNLPRWTLPPISRLTPLADLLSTTEGRAARGQATVQRRRVSLICCVITVTPPTGRPRRQAKAPRLADELLWMASWKVLSPSPASADGGRVSSEAASCEVKLWEECAKTWGGQVRRGDVILLQDVEFQPATTKPPSEACLILSPKNGSMPPAPVVLYRTLPRRDGVADDYRYRPGARRAVPANEQIRPEDQALRPDLGVLARSDVGVRRVRDMAQWCAEWVGGEAPPM